MTQGWGMTETSPGGVGLDAADAERNLGAAGKPLLHTEVKVVDDNGKELPWGEVGELYIRGPNITRVIGTNLKQPEIRLKETGLKLEMPQDFDDEGFIYIVDR